jgi:hypothetical protein
MDSLAEESTELGAASQQGKKPLNKKVKTVKIY